MFPPGPGPQPSSSKMEVMSCPRSQRMAGMGTRGRGRKGVNPPLSRLQPASLSSCYCSVLPRVSKGWPFNFTPHLSRALDVRRTLSVYFKQISKKGNWRYHTFSYECRAHKKKAGLRVPKTWILVSPLRFTNCMIRKNLKFSRLFFPKICKMT